MKRLMEGTADSKRCPRGSRAAFAGLDADRGLLRFLRNIAKNRKSFQTSGFQFGSGRRIRTLTNRVRVCRATLTQSRYFVFRFGPWP